MPGQERQTGSEWRKFLKKIVKRNDADWDGSFYFSRDGFD
jgi:hypothetical protein